METAAGGRQALEPTAASVAREGVIGGLIGAFALALWFLVADSMAGQPLFTPALLGARMFLGVSAAEINGMPNNAVFLVLGYSLVHGAAFMVAGIMIATAMAIFDRTPPVLIPGFFFLVVFFEFVYYTYVLAFVEPVFGAVNWVAMLIGNLVAVGSMASYYWRRHPDLLRRLARG